MSSMARGWESKNIEAQQAEREQAGARAEAVPPDEAARRARRRTLELTRARADADLARATVPAHRAMLEAAIEALDEQLAAL
jgi:hypothetical protein